ncbi:hypothetical protein VTK26DRAFT_3941 [Humicola hyalothermophila]
MQRARRGGPAGWWVGPVVQADLVVIRRRRKAAHHAHAHVHTQPQPQPRSHRPLPQVGVPRWRVNQLRAGARERARARGLRARGGRCRRADRGAARVRCWLRRVATGVTDGKAVGGGVGRGRAVVRGAGRVDAEGCAGGAGPRVKQAVGVAAAGSGGGGGGDGGGVGEEPDALGALGAVGADARAVGAGDAHVGVRDAADGALARLADPLVLLPERLDLGRVLR